MFATITAKIKHGPLCFQVLPLFESKEVGRVMGNMLEPPAIEAVANAVSRLQEVAALDSSQDLTPLGWHLAGQYRHIEQNILLRPKLSEGLPFFV